MSTEEKQKTDSVDALKELIERCEHCVMGGGCLLRNEMCWYLDGDQKKCSDYHAGGAIQDDKKKA